MTMPSLSIGQKLFVSSGIMAAVVISVAVLLAQLTTSIDREFESLSERTLEVIRTLDEIRFSGLRIVSSTNEYLMISFVAASNKAQSAGTSVEQSANEIALIDGGLAALTDSIHRYRTFVETYFPAERTFLNSIELAKTELAQASQNLTRTLTRHAPPAEILELKEKFESVEQEFLQSVDAAVAHERDEFETSKMEIVTILRKTTTGIWVGLSGTAAFVLLFGSWVSRGITQPIKRLTGAIRKVADGDLSIRVRSGSGDETGHLSNAFDQMVVDLNENTSRRAFVEEQLKLLNSELERRVDQRTAELRDAQNSLIRQERLAALGQLAATVSHELRNPLGTIRTSMMSINDKTETLDINIKPAIERIERNIIRCDTIINEMLDYSRETAAHKVLTNTDDWLGQLLDDQTKPEGITFRQSLDSGTIASIDRDRMRRAVINIFENACQAVRDNPDGMDREITVSSRRNGSTLEIMVSDSGPGIPQGDLQNIFEPLFSTKSSGIGLGLPVVRKITEEHGGGVKIISQIGKGTDVILWLPFEIEEPNGGNTS